MAYRFKLSEAFDDGVRRIAVQQIERSIAEMDGAVDGGRAIHETRKAIKRTRALLRLARPGLAAETFAAGNAELRDIGRLLAAPRDRQVMVETAGALELDTSGRAQSALAAARAALMAANGSAMVLPADSVADGVLPALRRVREQMADVTFRDPTFAAAFDGLELTYRQALRDRGKLADTGDPVASHEWRKRVQHHWRQMMLLTSAWPQMMEVRVATARALSNVLGQDHDIALLLAGLTGAVSPELTSGQRKAIEAAAHARQAALREEADRYARRLFAEKPKAFRLRIQRYWEGATKSRTKD